MGRVECAAWPEGSLEASSGQIQLKLKLKFNTCQHPGAGLYPVGEVLNLIFKANEGAHARLYLQSRL